RVSHEGEGRLMEMDKEPGQGGRQGARWSSHSADRYPCRHCRKKEARGGHPREELTGAGLDPSAARGPSSPMARRNFLVRLAYDGTDFSGWQRLRGTARGSGRSVQGELEKCLAGVLGLSGPDAAIETIGAGRTDAGVHAEGQAASFHAFTALGCDALKDALNARFPPDLACTSCVEVDPRFHARLHA